MERQNGRERKRGGSREELGGRELEKQDESGVVRPHVGIEGTGRGDDQGGEKKSGKQIVEERRERRVRLLHTVQHARQNTTSLYTTTATNNKYSKELFCRSRELTRAQLYRVIANCPAAEKPGLITLRTTNAISCLCFLSSCCHIVLMANMTHVVLIPAYTGEQD